MDILMYTECSNQTDVKMKKKHTQFIFAYHFMHLCQCSRTIVWFYIRLFFVNNGFNLTLAMNIVLYMYNLRNNIDFRRFFGGKWCIFRVEKSIQLLSTSINEIGRMEKNIGKNKIVYLQGRRTESVLLLFRNFWWYFSIHNFGIQSLDLQRRKMR